MTLEEDAAYREEKKEREARGGKTKRIEDQLKPETFNAGPERALYPVIVLEESHSWRVLKNMKIIMDGTKYSNPWPNRYAHGDADWVEPLRKISEFQLRPFDLLRDGGYTSVFLRWVTTKF